MNRREREALATARARQLRDAEAHGAAEHASEQRRQQHRRDAAQADRRRRLPSAADPPLDASTDGQGSDAPTQGRHT